VKLSGIPQHRYLLPTLQLSLSLIKQPLEYLAFDEGVEIFSSVARIPQTFHGDIGAAEQKTGERKDRSPHQGNFRCVTLHGMGSYEMLKMLRMTHKSRLYVTNEAAEERILQPANMLTQSGSIGP
jgi:hypothetical protein